MQRKEIPDFNLIYEENDCNSIQKDEISTKIISNVFTSEKQHTPNFDNIFCLEKSDDAKVTQFCPLTDFDNHLPSNMPLIKMLPLYEAIVNFYDNNYSFDIKNIFEQ